MLRTFYGTCFGAFAGALPVLVCLLIARDRLWELKLNLVLIAGTAAIVGAIAGSTSAVLDTFRRHRGRGHSRKSDS